MQTPSEKKIIRRTDRQNRALHLYFRMIADELNAGGLNVQLVLKQKMDIDWTPELVKEALWRPAQKVIVQKASTRLLKKAEEIDKIYEHLNRHLGEKFGIYVPFPHFDREEEYIKATTL